MSILNAPYFHDEMAAFAHLEAILWPKGPVCPHCGGNERIYKLEGVKDKRGNVRLGLHKCGHCRKQFTVRVGTVFESSHVPLHLWLQATYLMVASKKGISAHQLHRCLEVTYKTAWFMAHRIREAMKGSFFGRLGGPGKVVEVDETFIGQSAHERKKRGGYSHKQKVLSLVERDGNVRSFHIRHATTDWIIPIVKAQIAKESTVYSDDAGYYKHLKKSFAEHETVRHTAREYGRGKVHTNTIEGYFSIFKRGMRGIYQHCKEKHLHRYLAEFDFRYNHRKIDDRERASQALKGIVGRRLTYGGPSGQQKPMVPA